MRFTFPRWSLPAAALTPILLLAACADSAPPPPQVEKAQPASLYDRLGGKPAIAAVVDDFVANVAADKRVNAAFRKANTARLKARLNEQLCEASGGPCKYAGRSMKTVHKSMGITDAQFDAVVEDFKKTLDKFRVPSTEQAELTEAGINHHAHHFHHAAVVDRLVAADEDALVWLLAIDRFQLGRQFGQVVLGLAEENLVLGVDRDDERLVLAADLLGAGLGQVDRHADLQQRRGDHEDHQQHQHHVDIWHDVDLIHHLALTHD